MDGFDVVVERIVSSAAQVMLIGGLDTGKTTLGRALARAALAAGRTVAYLDADVGQKSVGPPTTVTLRLLGGREDLEPERMVHHDAMSFVGATSPQGQLLPLVVGSALMLSQARSLGADLVVVDTNGLVAGVYGQILKYHKIELLRPDAVIALQRGEELEPLIGIIRRFFSTEVVVLPVHPNVRATSVEDRAARREAAFRRYFAEPLHRWKVKPTVFMPALPALFESRHLDRLLVGLFDGRGECIGLGHLECEPETEVLRLISPVADGPKALKLGSVRLESDFRVRRVDLRNLFGTD